MRVAFIQVVVSTVVECVNTVIEKVKMEMIISAIMYIYIHIYMNVLRKFFKLLGSRFVTG